jgi:hypothetical protein
MYTTTDIEPEEIILVIGSSTLRAMELIQDPRIRTCIKPGCNLACFNNPDNLITIGVRRFLQRYATDDSYKIIACLVYFGNHSRHGEDGGLMNAYTQMFTQLENGSNPCYRSVIDAAGEGVLAMGKMLRKYLSKSQPISLMCPLPASYSDTELVEYMMKYGVIPSDNGSGLLHYRKLVTTLVRRMNGDMWTPMKHINKRICKRLTNSTYNINSFDLWTEVTGNRPVVQGKHAVMEVYNNVCGKDISCHLNYEALIPLILRQFSKLTAVNIDCNLDALKCSRESYEMERQNRPFKRLDIEVKPCLQTHKRPIQFISGGMLSDSIKKIETLHND